MTTLSIDIETYSETDLIKSGVYKYVEDPHFEILMIATYYSGWDIMGGRSAAIFDLKMDLGNPETCVWLKSFTEDLLNPETLKTAFNANFERTCLQKYLGIDLPPEQWECTQVKAGMLGLPMNLEKTGEVLNLKTQKDARGKALIKYFSVPCKPTKANGGRTRNLPQHDPEKWQAFKDYCVQDVNAERAIAQKISFFTIPEQEKKLWCLDQRINERGAMIDKKFVINAVRIDQAHHKLLFEEACSLTALDNPNSVSQLKAWLEAAMDEEIESLNKESVPALLGKTDNDAVTRVLQVRQELSKTSIKKYVSMLNCVCADGRVRGLLQFYGANRTGRWAGRLVQLQNLKRSEDGFDMDNAREAVKDGDRDEVEMLFGDVPDTLSQLIRTAFIAKPGNRLLVADFSAIEARVIAWLAGEKWRLDLFKEEKTDIYIASAAQMFKMDPATIDKKNPLRQKGKIAELACGFGGGVGALLKMGAIKMGLTEEELPAIIAAWRKANPRIVKLWDLVDKTVKETLKTGAPGELPKGVRVRKNKGCLFLDLPSGRSLSYVNAKIEQGEMGSRIAYDGMNQTTRLWGKQDTYGGKLVENIVQGIARDCLSDAMLRVHDASYPIIFHVHDEIVCEVPNGQGSLQEVLDIMSEPIPWAPGLPLAAAGFESHYYKKD